MELELTGPTSRASLYWQRLAALWINVLSLVLVVAVMTLLLVTLLDLDVAFTNLAAATLGLALLALAFATLAYGVGAATGRRGIALGGAAGVAVGSFMLNAIGPTVDADWMTAVSPFSWYSDPSPLLHGPNVVGFALLVALTSVATVGGLLRYIRRDLMV